MLSDLRRLRHFVIVAESGSFSRAAATLHLSQQAISSSMRQFETEVGIALFQRKGRGIALTAAGRSLLQQAHPLLAAATTVTEHVRDVAAGERAWLVGYSPALSRDEAYMLVEPAIMAFPTMSFTFQQIFPHELSAAVADGSIQLGLRRGIAPASEVAAAVIGYHRMRVVVPAGHRLAGASEIAISDLTGETLTLWAPPGMSRFSDLLMGAFQRAGFEPSYVVSRIQGAGMLAAPLATGAVAIATAEPGPALGGRVIVIELEPPLLLPVQALWQRHTSCDVRETLLTARESLLEAEQLRSSPLRHRRG